jgi:hypothetical protein
MYQTNTLTNNYSLNRTQIGSGLRINLRAINRFLVAGIIVSFLAFLIGNNDLAVKSFVLKDLKNNLSELTWQNKELEVKVTGLSSYQHLSQKGSELRFVPANNIKYLPANNQLLAKK